jgi:hypothetical protein
MELDSSFPAFSIFSPNSDNSMYVFLKVFCQLIYLFTHSLVYIV